MNESILKHRLQNQQIHAPKATTPAELVAWMGAMQAQDYDMSKWAIGTRLPNYTEGGIETALNNGDILRTHVLRPTWHLVSPADIRWMLALSKPQIEKLIARQNQHLGLDLATLNQSDKIIENALHEHHNLTRDELMTELAHHGIIASSMRAAHIMFQAELSGLVCNGIRKGKQPTYALLDKRAPLTKPLHRDEALHRLAKNYFQSHSPATVKDFSWWSGLSMPDARKAIESIKDQLETWQVDKTIYYLFSLKTIENTQKDIILLPAFDEYMVSYTDRTAALSPEFTKQTITSNGIFSPIIVHRGKVIGLWKRQLKGKYVEIELLPFEAISVDLRLAIQEAFVGYREYLGGVELRFVR